MNYSNLRSAACKFRAFSRIVSLGRRVRGRGARAVCGSRAAEPRRVPGAVPVPTVRASPSHWAPWALCFPALTLLEEGNPAVLPPARQSGDSFLHAAGAGLAVSLLLRNSGFFPLWTPLATSRQFLPLSLQGDFRLLFGSEPRRPFMWWVILKVPQCRLGSHEAGPCGGVAPCPPDVSRRGERRRPASHCRGVARTIEFALLKRAIRCFSYGRQAVPPRPLSHSRPFASSPRKARTRRRSRHVAPLPSTRRPLVALSGALSVRAFHVSATVHGVAFCVCHGARCLQGSPCRVCISASFFSKE